MASDMYRIKTKHESVETGRICKICKKNIKTIYDLDIQTHTHIGNDGKKIHEDKVVSKRVTWDEYFTCGVKCKNKWLSSYKEEEEYEYELMPNSKALKYIDTYK